MSNKDELLSYKGYHGTVEHSLKDNILYGQVVGINSLIFYKGKTLDELKEDFQGTIDDYLEMYKDHGVTPEKPSSGRS